MDMKITRKHKGAGVGAVRSMSKLGDLVDSNGATLLHNAVKSGKETEVRWLINEKLDVNARTKNGITPLMSAVEGDSVRIINLLLEAKADLDSVDNHGENALSKFSKRLFPFTRLKVSIFKTIIVNVISKCKAMEEIAAKMFFANIPLYVAAIVKNVEIIKFYLDQGIDIDLYEPVNKRTALHMCVHLHDWKSVELLLSRGADINAQDDRGYTPIIYIVTHMMQIEIIPRKLKFIESEQIKVLKVLLHYGADLSQVYPVLRYCCKDAVQQVLQTNIDLQEKNGHGKTPLQYIAENPNPGVFDLIQYHTFDINARDDNDDTPLHIATSNGSIDVIRFLIDRGVNINSQNKQGLTPLLLSVLYSLRENSNNECFELLLQYRADVQIMTYTRSTILNLTNRNYELINPVIAHLAILESTGGKILNGLIEMIDSNIRCKIALDSYRIILEELKQTTIHESLTIYDFLIASEKKLMNYLRNKKLASVLKGIKCSNEYHEYYYQLLRGQVDCALRKLKFMKHAGDALCKIIPLSYESHPNIIDQICNYLNYPDVLRLAEVE